MTASQHHDCLWNCGVNHGSAQSCHKPKTRTTTSGLGQELLRYQKPITSHCSCQGRVNEPKGIAPHAVQGVARTDPAEWARLLGAMVTTASRFGASAGGGGAVSTNAPCIQRFTTRRFQQQTCRVHHAKRAATAAYTTGMTREQNAIRSAAERRLRPSRYHATDFTGHSWDVMRAVKSQCGIMCHHA
jgi:hypothetical protein